MSTCALVIVDMLKDNVRVNGPGMLDKEATKIVPVIVELSRAFRSRGCRVVFACDSFMEGDFIFQGRMKPHAIRGTGGDHPLAELEMQPGDLFLPKRRMSSFYKTDLDQTLRTWGVDTVVVCGIVTNVCVLLTAMDAIQNDFRAVIVSDACACHDPALHDATLKLYESFLLHGIFNVMTCEEVVRKLVQAAGG